MVCLLEISISDSTKFYTYLHFSPIPYIFALRSLTVSRKWLSTAWTLRTFQPQVSVNACSGQHRQWPLIIMWVFKIPLISPKSPQWKPIARNSLPMVLSSLEKSGESPDVLEVFIHHHTTATIGMPLQPCPRPSLSLLDCLREKWSVWQPAHFCLTLADTEKGNGF